MARPFILRSAGFAAATMDTLCMHQAAAATDAALQARDDLVALGARLQLDLRSRFAARRESMLRWKTVHKAFNSGRSFSELETDSCRDDAELHLQLMRWNESVRLAGEADAHAEASFAAGLQQARQALHALACDERFQEAVFLSSPHMYSSGLLKFVSSPPGQTRSADDKRLDRQLVMYLQRVCTKNETTSFFGPIGYGRFDTGSAADAKTGWPVSWQQSVPLGCRHTFMAYWAVEVLAAGVSALGTVRTRLHARLQPGVRRASRTTLVIAALNRSVELPAEAADLLDAVQRGDDVQTLLLQHDSELLATMERRGLLQVGIAIPAGEVHTLEYLARQLDPLPDAADLRPWRCGIACLIELKNTFAAAGLADRPRLLQQAEALFSSLTGHVAHRSGGKVYADRSLFYEECRSGHDDVRVSKAFGDEMQAHLARLLDLFAAHALERRKHLRRLGVEIFKKVFGPGVERVPFLHFVHRVSAQQPSEVAAWAESMQGFRSQAQLALLASLKAVEASLRHEVELQAELLHSLGGAPQPVSDVPMLASPDVMIARRADGRPLVVLGEVHDTLMVWGWALAFHPTPGALADEMRGFAHALQLDRVLNMIGSSRRKILPFEYPGRTVEVRTAVGGANPTLPVSHLDVVLKDGELALHDGDDPVPLDLHNGELPSLCHALFSLPRCVPFELDLGAHTPRLLAGDVVLQRERWRVERTTCGLAASYPGTSYALFRDVRRLRRSVGLPERVFLKSPSEPKPIYIDFRCHLLVEAFDTLLTAGKAVTLSEMLPDSDQLWLTGSDCRHVTAELRLAFGRPADAAPALHTPLRGTATCKN